MTGGELINRLYEEVETNGWTDAEIFAPDVFVLIYRILKPIPTEDEIEKAKTINGGWTRKQLEAWGVPWPPPHGWRKSLIQEGRKKLKAVQSCVSSLN